MTIQNILVVKLSAIGDVIHALPVSYALKETFPAAKVTWVVEPPAYDLLTNNPYIDRILVFEKKKYKSLRGLVKHAPSFSSVLKAPRFDVALDLQGLFKSAAIAWLSGAPLRLGCCDMREGSRLVSRPVCGPHRRGHIVERYLDVARELGCRVEKVVFPIVVTAAEAERAQKIAARAGLDMRQPYIALAIGANWPNKRWPTAHYARLADAIYDQNRIPVLIGGPGDRPLAADIAARAAIPPVDLTGKTSLKELACVVRQARALVGGDTGPMHLAAGLGTNVVALLGPTDANRNGPYGGRRSVAVRRDCRGCWERACPKGLDCLADIAPQEVLAALNEQMAGH